MRHALATPGVGPPLGLGQRTEEGAQCGGEFRARIALAAPGQKEGSPVILALDPDAILGTPVVQKPVPLARFVQSQPLRPLDQAVRVGGARVGPGESRSVGLGGHCCQPNGGQQGETNGPHITRHGTPAVPGSQLV